jgi:outer membrane protein assembly factor BamB
MLVNHFQVATHDPLTSRALAEKKDLLRDDPPNEKLKQEIRELDLEIRQRFFRHLAFNQTGAWFLLGGLAAFLVFARTLVVRRATPPSPRRRADDAVAPSARTRPAAARWPPRPLAAGLLLLLALVGKTLVPDNPEALARAARRRRATPTPAHPEEIRANWPQFRGPTGDGVATTTNLPIDWNGATGDGIAWKSPVPLPGFSSPIVWQDRVFVSGGNETARAVFCFSATTDASPGRDSSPMPAPPGGKLEVQEFTGVAAPTPATDGRRVFAIFATGELVAFHTSTASSPGRSTWVFPRILTASPPRWSCTTKAHRPV